MDEGKQMRKVLGKATAGGKMDESKQEWDKGVHGQDQTRKSGREQGRANESKHRAWMRPGWQDQGSEAQGCSRPARPTRLTRTNTSGRKPARTSAGEATPAKTNMHVRRLARSAWVGYTSEDEHEREDTSKIEHGATPARMNVSGGDEREQTNKQR